ncbi:MAG: GTPase Era [Acidobacteria bacterium]|nr:GTPase Era [Acidobacteriota bacterium]
MSFRSGFVTLLGRPNTGKSTLLNALLGTKVAIVSPRPQTTRTRLQGVLTSETAQIVFVDTPGVHRPTTRMNQGMMESVRGALEGVDLVLLVVDASRPLNAEDEQALELVRSFGGASILVLNKIDRIEKPVLLPLIDHFHRRHSFKEFIPVSALQGENLRLLEGKIVEALPEGPPYFPPDTLTDQPERFLAAEIIREKIFHETRQEVPYGTAVVVDRFEETGAAESGRDLVRIHATIFVDKESHKGILIGARGTRMKEIGQAARQELESLLGRRVYLELFVKTRAEWRERPGVERLIDWRHGEA